MSLLWLGSFPRRHHPGSPSYAWNFDLIFRRRAGNNVRMDSANFQTVWTTFGISFIFRKRNTSYSRKK